MKQKIIYIFILALSIWTFYNSYTSTSNSVLKEIKENVIYIKDGKVKEENEGKLVLVTGSLQVEEDIILEDIPFEFNTCKISIEVEEKIDGKWEYSDKSKEEVKKAKIGEFNIEANLVDKISAFPYYMDELEGYKKDEDSNFYVNESETTRVKFQYVNLKKEYSVLGKQVNGKIEKYDLKSRKQPLYDIYARKIEDEEGLEKVFQKQKTNKTFFTFILLVIVLFIGYDIFFKKQEEKGK